MTLKLFFGLIICICLALTISSVPAAANPADTGFVNDSLLYQNDYHDAAAAYCGGGGTGTSINAIWFYHIESFNSLTALAIYANSVPGSGVIPLIIGNQPTYSCGFFGTCNVNVSSQNIDFRDSQTNAWLGYGVETYTIDPNNNIYFAVTPQYWTTAGLTGTRKVNITVGGVGWTPEQGNSNGCYLITPGTDLIKDVYFILPDTGTTGSKVSGFERLLNFQSQMGVQYQRTIGSVYDTWTFTRNVYPFGRTTSNVTLEFQLNGTYHVVISDVSSQDLTSNSTIQTPHTAKVRLTVTNPVTGRSQVLIWNPIINLANDIAFNYFNGNAAGNTISEKAATSISFYTSNLPDYVGKVVWQYTHSGNQNNPDTKTYIKNTTDNLWYLGGAGIGYDWGTVETLNTNFLCSDYNTSSSCNLVPTFTGTGRNAVHVYLYSNDFASNVFGGAQVYVGNYAIVPNVIFNTEDATTQAAINVGGTYHIYDNSTSTDSTSTGATYAMDLKYGDVYTFWYIPNQFRVAFYRFSSNGTNPWGNSYNDYMITAQWANWTGPRYVTAFISQAVPGYNTTTFQIVDMNGNPIPNVQVTTTAAIIPNVTYSDTTGIAAFSVPTSGTYQFTFTASGYQTYQYSVTVTKDIWTTITLNPGIATPTTTPTTAAPTVTPTTGPTPPAGGVTDFWGNIGYWLQLIGIPLGQLQLVGAVAMIAVFTFGGMFVAGKAEQGGLGGLVGAIVGFISSAMVGWISMAWVAILMVICAVFFAAKFWPSGA